MTAPESTLRVFVAVSISDTAREALEGTLRRLNSQITTGVRWVDPAGIHLTMKFLGNVADSRIQDISQAMRTSAEMAATFRVRLSGLGVFPNERRPRVLWAGVQGDLDKLDNLRDALESSMADLGLPRDGKLFNPHLTLGRVRDKISEANRRKIGATVKGESLSSADFWSVESVQLMQSHLSQSGATYTVLATSALGKGNG